jgi:hypothetical protein
LRETSCGVGGAAGVGESPCVEIVAIGGRGGRTGATESRSRARARHVLRTPTIGARIYRSPDDLKVVYPTISTAGRITGLWGLYRVAYGPTFRVNEAGGQVEQPYIIDASLSASLPPTLTTCHRSHHK